VRNSKSKDLTLMVLQPFGIGWAASDKLVNKRFDPYAYAYALCPTPMIWSESTCDSPVAWALDSTRRAHCEYIFRA